MKALTKAQIVTGLRGFAAMVFTIAASPVLHEVGVSFQVISLGFGVLYSILAIAEIPTGVWADLFGARKSAIFGGALQTFSLIVLGLSSSETWQVLSGFALYGLGSSFVSGALSALLFGINKEQDGANFNSNRYFSMTEKAAVASYIVASISGGFLTAWIGKGAFIFAGAFYLIAAVFIAVLIRELPPEREFHSTRKEFVIRISEGLSAIGNSIQLKALLPIRILHQVETILGVLWLPWIQQLGGGDARWFSVLATGSYLLRYGVNHYFSDKARPTSYMPRVAYSLACMAFGSLICVYAENVWIALFGVWTMAGARGAFLPAVQAIQHEEFPERVRTTGLSVMNFSTEAIFAVSYFVSAAFINQLSVQVAWGISVFCFVASTLVAALVFSSKKTGF
jgi:MFS family permease